MRALLLSLLVLCLVPAAANAASATFSYTGGEQTFTVPPGVTTVHAVAQGANGVSGAFPSGATGGHGAVVGGDISVTPGQTLYVEVGGAPTLSANCYVEQPCVGGFNGGGSGGGFFSAGGGGASDVRTVARADTNTLTSRLIVAAGGGSAGDDSGGSLCPGSGVPGAGGDAGADGGTGDDCDTGQPSTGGRAGTQTAGGAGGSPGGGAGTLGQGGAGTDDSGAGGGGLYGGGGGGGKRIFIADDGHVIAITPSGGGGGGSNLVPSGGSSSIATSGSPQIVITYAQPTAIVATSGSGQSATAGQNFAQPLVATVTDTDGNALPGAPVTFTVSSGSASFGGNPSATVNTNAGGQATSPTLTAGSTAGPVTVTASTPGVTESATFLETVTAAGPARADLAVTLTAPSSANRGQTITVTLAVKNNGPSAAGKVLSGITVPRGFTVVNAGGGTYRFGTVFYSATTLASGQTATYTLTLKAGTKKLTSVLLAGTLSSTIDPKLSNNLAARSIRIN